MDPNETPAAAFDNLKAKIRSLEAALQASQQNQGGGTAPAPTAADFDALSAEIDSLLTAAPGAPPVGSGSTPPGSGASPTPVPTVNPGDSSAPAPSTANTLPPGVVSPGAPAPSQGTAQAAINALNPVG